MAELGTPLWWLETLEQELANRQPEMKRMDAYYRGEHPLPFLTKAHEHKIRSEFRELLDDSRSNFMRLVVDAVEERLAVEGFRLSAAADPVADEATWEIWQANQMDQESSAAFVESLVKGVAYLSVWAGDDHPVIAVEDPLETIVAYEPGSNFRRRAAALKVWRDGWTGQDRATVYLPDGLYKFASAPKADAGPATPVGQALSGDEKRKWRELEDEFVRNPLGVVPIVPLRNRPRLLVEGESELADAFRLQNQVNALTFLLALAGYFGAHKQRWAIGLQIHEDANGRPIEPFDVAVDRLWHTEQPAEGPNSVRFGEFQNTDLKPYIDAIEQKVLHLAVTTRTPRHYLIQQGQSPSGDAIRSAEAGLVKKARRKQRPFGEGLEEALRLARLFAGEQDAPVDSEIVWADPETRTEAETTDATIKQFAGGLIPWEAALEKLGYSQTQIQRFQTMRAGEGLSDRASDTQDEEMGLMAQRLGLSVRNGVMSQDEARSILRTRFGVELDDVAPSLEDRGAA